MKNHLKILSILLIVFIISCELLEKISPSDEIQVLSEIKEEVGSSAETISLQGTGSIQIQSGTFSVPLILTFQKTDDENREDYINNARIIYNMSQVVAYEVRIKVMDFIPQQDFLMTLDLPSGLLNSTTNITQVKLYGQYHYESNSEEIMDYHIIPSEIDNQNKLIASLTPSFFTKKSFELDGTQKEQNEAILVMAISPHRDNTQRTICAEVGGSCQGEFIGCPLPDCGVEIKDYVGPRDLDNDGIDECHRGTDYSVNNVPVYAAASGKIFHAGCSVRQGCDGGFGKYIIMRHDESNSHTLYGHLSELHVSKGDSVIGGEQIGVSGNTGRSTGPHLHFGYFPNMASYQKEGAVDPTPCIDEDGLRLLDVDATILGINDCEHELNQTNSGTSWYARFDFRDPQNTITDQAEIVFECLNCIWQTNNETTLILPASELSEEDGIVSVPDFCAKWGEADKFEFEVYIDASDGRESNHILFDMFRPEGALRIDNGRGVPSPFKQK